MCRVGQQGRQTATEKLIGTKNNIESSKTGKRGNQSNVKSKLMECKEKVTGKRPKEGVKRRILQRFLDIVEKRPGDGCLTRQRSTN